MNELLYEGKAKRVYAAQTADLCLMEYKNTATALNGEKKEDFEGKGELNCAICSSIFEYLEANGVPTHYVQRLSNTSMLAKRVEIVPLEVITRNIAAGSFSKKYGVEEGTELESPSFEFSYKNDALGDPMINKSQILALKLATDAEMVRILELAAKINGLLIKYFHAINLKLVDFKLEFGRLNGQIILADEISPDTCRLWDTTTLEKLDKDRFRRDLGGFLGAYKEVYKRICAIEGKK